MTGTCRLNNKVMRNIRKEQTYQALAIDLAMLGVISKEECEMLIGSGIPTGLVLPNGEAGNLISEKEMPEQLVKTEETPEEETEEQTEETPEEQTEETSEEQTEEQTEETSEEQTEEQPDDERGTESDN